MSRHRPTLALAAAVALAGATASACKHGATAAGGDGGVTTNAAGAPEGGPPGSPELPVLPGATSAPGASAASGKPLLGVTAFVATIYKEPRDTSKKLGYLRVGAKVPRSEAPVGKAGLPGRLVRHRAAWLRVRGRRRDHRPSTRRSSGLRDLRT